MKPKAAAWRVLQARYATRGLTLDSDPQLDLGIDSLEWLNLGFELESVLGLRRIEQSKTADSTDVGTAANIAQDEADWLAPKTRAEELAGTLLYAIFVASLASHFACEWKG